MAEDPLEPYKRASSEFRRVMEGLAQHFKTKLQLSIERMQSPSDFAGARELGRIGMEFARTEFEAELERAREVFHRELRNLGHPQRRRGGRRRRPPAAEAAPVEPRPNPKPLVDGAEAPIE